MGWLIALAVLALLGAMPVGIQARFDHRGGYAAVIVGPVHIGLYPRNKKKSEKKTKKTEAKQEKPSEVEKKAPAQSTEPPKQEPSPAGGSWKDFLPLVKTALAFLGQLRRKLRINHLQCDLVLAGEDPCDLAIAYGRAWTALGNLLGVLEESFVIKKRNVQVQCDFCADETRIRAGADITLSLARALALVIRYGIRALKDYWNLRKIRKGGMNHE